MGTLKRFFEKTRGMTTRMRAHHHPTRKNAGCSPFAAFRRRRTLKTTLLEEDKGNSHHHRGRQRHVRMITQKALRGGDDDVERGEEEEEEEEEEGKATTTIQMTKRQLAMASLAVTMQTTTGMLIREEAKADEILSNFWEQIDLPLDPGVILLDVAFTDEDAKHGFLLGTRQTILETFDGGKTWDAKDLGADLIDDDVNYRFNSVSFRGDEGWIVGKPAILLHTTDAGKTWERVGLSPRLPGIPVLITATGDDGVAEMVTDQGAIYLTTDAARNWKAAVEETVDATLNRTVSSGVQGASYYTVVFHGFQKPGNRGVYRFILPRELSHVVGSRTSVLATA